MHELKKRVALVTGSTSGIGFAIASRLANDGVQLALLGIQDPSEFEVQLKRLQASSACSAKYYQADLRDRRAIESTIRAVQEDFGGVDILINNAGMQHVSPVEEFPPEIWDDMIAVNLSASFHTVRLCLPGMRIRNWGRIINIASISGLRGRAGKSAYNATKHGLIGFTKSVALETAATSITCNAICPGWALTPIVQAQIDAYAMKHEMDNVAATQALIGARQPSGRPIRLEQLSALAAFLCSENASEVRGAAWTMDGGTTAG